MEKVCIVRGYCVSLEKGHGDKFLDKKRHLSFDFSNRKFFYEVRNEFVVGHQKTPVKFSQVSFINHVYFFHI